MLFKNLKSIFEAETQNAQDTKTQNVVQVDNTSDGVGNETYDVAMKLTMSLKAIIKNYLPTAKTITSSKGALFITGKFENNDETTALVQMAISAELDYRGLGQFDIQIKIRPTKIIVTFLSKS